jgi:hypothetical protein
LVWGFSYFAWEIPIVLTDESLVRPFFVAERVLNDIGVVTFVLFTRLVFRSRERWAWWLVAGITLSQLIGVGGSISVGDWEGVNPLGNPWWWPEALAAIASVVWMGSEGFGQYRMARQRLRLGLCDPLVCNRYLLWGLAGATWTIWEVAATAQLIEYQVIQVWSATMDSLVGGLEVGAIAFIWLVFFPPAAYRRWINRAAPAAVER